MSNAVEHDRQPPLKLIVIEQNSIFRVGLLASLKQFADLQVILTANSVTIAQQQLQSTEIFPDVMLLSFEFGEIPDQALELAACQQWRSTYPNTPILLLGSLPEPVALAGILQSGVSGFCLKTTDVSELVIAIRQVAAGQTYWTQVAGLLTQVLQTAPTQSPIAVMKQNLRASGLGQITAAIDKLNQQLQQPQLSLMERLFLQGQRRELRAAGWIVNRLLATQSPTIQLPQSRENLPSTQSEIPDSAIIPVLNLDPFQARSLQAILFDRVATKLEANLLNLTETPLEIDILKSDKKQELLYLILRKLEEILADLRFSQVQLERLADQRSQILIDLWQAVVRDFFGRYYTVDLGDRAIIVSDVLLADAALIQAEILNKIPLIHEFLAHLLFQIPLTIDGAVYPTGTIAATLRMEILLENLVIQLANAVIQPLLNRFGDVTPIKQAFYHKRLFSSREIQRFRNNLSWKYRLQQYFAEPTAIFESRFYLFTLEDGGIRKTSIYAPRNQELAELSNLQYAVTLALEARDAIAPRLQTTIAFVGSGMVYLLTEIIGRGIGLVGRGIIKGIGNAVQDYKTNRTNPRSR
jgi:DNA-binding NarL/FixJ family response regulator